MADDSWMRDSELVFTPQSKTAVYTTEIEKKHNYDIFFHPDKSGQGTPN
jgi:hypothetical protein